MVLTDLYEVKGVVVRYLSSLFSTSPRRVPIDEEIIRSVISGIVSSSQS